MKIVQIVQNIDLQIGNNIKQKRLNGGESYILSDTFLQKLKRSVPAALGIERPFSEACNEYNGEDLNGKKIFMIRHGGGGDILFMSTGIKELKRKFPEATICVAIKEQYIGLIEAEQEIFQIFSLPLELKKWETFDYHLTFEGLVENNLLATQYNAYDLFMMKMGLDIKKVSIENKIPEITISEIERKMVEKELGQLKRKNKRVGIQIESSTPIRNYPVHNLYKVAKSLLEDGFDIFFFGSKVQDKLISSMIRELGAGSFNASSDDLRKSVILSSFMDFFIAPDSVFIHIAGALRIPLLGLYGPFPSESRMRYFKNSIGIDIQAGCSPCFKHSSFPCSKGSPSPCLNAISPEIVLDSFKVLEKEVNQG